MTLPARPPRPTPLDRLRAAGLRRIARFVVPRRVDELLYTADLAATRPLRPAAVPVLVRRYDLATPSGDTAVDARLTAWRACYIGSVDGEAAHQSWLFFDTTLPSLFGFDGSVPVIGECATADKFRGKGIYPHVLQHILADVRARGLAEQVYILVSAHNAPSIAGIERAGFTRQAHLRGIRCGPVVLRRPGRETRGTGTLPPHW